MKLLKIYANVNEVMKDNDVVIECGCWIDYALKDFKDERVYMLEDECESIYFCRLNEETNELETYCWDEEEWVEVLDLI